VTRIVLDADGVQRLLDLLHGRATGPAAEEPGPIRDADDLHEVHLDAELWHRPPEQPSGTEDR
jgi:hypothetical protein